MASAYFQQMLAIIAAGAGGVAPMLRSASTLNSVAPQGYQAGSDTRTDNVFRIPFQLGSCDWNDLRASLYNWVFSDFGISFSGGSDFQIVALAFEINGSWKAATWAGATSKTIANGVTDEYTDPVYPSDFGISGDVFTRGTEGFFRIQVRANSSQKWPTNPLAPVVGGRFRFNPGEVTMSPGVYGVGEFEPSDWDLVEWSGGSPPAPVLIGTPSSSGKFVAGIGDSITASVGDTSSPNGAAFSRVAYSNYSTKADPIAVMKFGWSGGTLLNWIGNGTGDASASSADATNIGLAEAYLKYSNIIFEQYGTNGAYSTGGGTYTHTDKLWAVIRRGSPGCKLVRSSLFPRSSSSDAWATVGNQTATQSPGGDTDLFEQYCAGKVGSAVDYYINYDSIRADANRATANYYKWLTNGTANWPTEDGLHPSSNTYALMYGGEARALIDAITP